MGTSINVRLKKGYLQWRCRRGTKELDMVLSNFLETNYDTLSDTEIRHFDSLLETQDTTLWYWLIGKEKPTEESLKAMIKKINFRS